MAVVTRELPSNGIIEQVFEVISKKSGAIRTSDLDELFENKQQDVRYAITKLTVMGRISRKRGLGVQGIEYYYHDVSSQSFAKYRKMGLERFHY